MQKYKIDWLSFSVRCYDDEPTNTLDENLLELLGYDFAEEFSTDISGKNFYNRGATIGGTSMLLERLYRHKKSRSQK